MTLNDDNNGKGCLITFTINNSNGLTGQPFVFRSGLGYRDDTSSKLRVDHTSVNELGDTNSAFSSGQYIDFNGPSSLVLQIDGLAIVESDSDISKNIGSSSVSGVSIVLASGGTLGLQPGMIVYGHDNIQDNTIISSIVSSTQITISQSLSRTISGGTTIKFSNHTIKNIVRTPEFIFQTTEYINNSTTINNTKHIYNNFTSDFPTDQTMHAIGDGIPEGVTVTYNDSSNETFTFSQAITVESGTTIYFKKQLTEPEPSRIYIKNQTNLNENGIYFINNVDSDDNVTFTRANDFNSIYDKLFNPYGDVRPGDYAFITSGFHNNNRDHAFVLSNEHIDIDTDTGGKTITVGNGAKVTTTHKKFGSSSLILDGTDDYLSLAATSDFNVYSSSFTLEFYVRFHSTSTNYGENRYIVDFSSSSCVWVKRLSI